MGRSMRKTALREIKHTFGRFTAILAIIALGVGFFAGVRDTTPAMVNMMDKFLDENQFYDYRLISTLGWDNDSVKEFSQQPDVRYAEGSISFDVLFKKGNREFVMKTHMLPRNINDLLLVEGELPTKENECAAENDRGLKIGDKIQVHGENSKNVTDTLGETVYTVTALVESSFYINHERGTTSVGDGTVSGFVYLPEAAFNTDSYTEIFIRFDHDKLIYSDDYDSFIEEKKSEWERLAEETANKRYDDVIAEAEAELSDGKAELEEKRAEGKQELDDAQKELDESEKKLNEAKSDLDSAKKELDEGEKELNASKKKIDDGKKELEKSKKTLDSSKAALDESEKQLIEGEASLSEGQSQLDSAWNEYHTGLAGYEAEENAFYSQYGELLAMLDYLPDEQQSQLKDGLAQLETAKSQLDSAKAELDSQQSVLDASRSELEAGRAEFESGRDKYERGLSEYEKAEAELQKGVKEYEDGLKKWKNGKKEYDDGLAEYEDGLSEYNDGLADYKSGLAEFNERIADAEREISDAEQDIADLKSPSVYVLDRNTNIGYALFENDSEIVAQVAKVFPIFFILVAALVCMTTMSRMVEEQRTQIGMFKALGYSEAAVMGKFMFYSGSASLIGCIVGFALGTFLFPAIIWMTYKLIYIPLDIPYYFDLKLAVIVVFASLLCSLGTTWVSCRAELSETAAGLMRPKSPKAGKRVLLEYIPFIWNRMKFLHKVSARNIFRYKGRFFMMIVGIGGCMALLLTGFGLKDSIAGFADIQFEQIQIADAAVTFETDKTSAVRTLLDEKTESSLMLRHSSWNLLYGNRVKSIDLEAAEDFEKIGSFMCFRDEKGKPLDSPQLGEALVSHSISERYNVKTGDDMTLRDENMRELHLKVTGVFENHAYNYVYISKETYEAQLGEEMGLNKAFVNFSDNDDHTKLTTELRGSKNIISAELFENTKERMAEMMSSLDYIVLLVIVCAAALAFIVIYNLTNINITERTREIATIKVLGFFRRETSAYVLRENLALTAMGIIAGILLGVPLHSFVISCIKVDIVDFSTIILPMSYVYSILLTFAFNFIVNLFMAIKLERINMAESLKSVD
ncbi:MAG: ABC transporter permease [Ruminococcus sp.]|nr:ABC transporter permease [Ruminococcus sp.]